MSTTDPDASVAKKPGKPRMLCYSSMMSVDTKHHIITHMSAEKAHKKDSRYLIKTVIATKNRLAKCGLETQTILADTRFSSGENYATLEQLGLDSYIPVHGVYKPKRDGFIYNQNEDIYTCSEEHVLPFRQTGKAGGYYKKRYLSKKKVCDQCPIRKSRVGTIGYKQIEHTIHKNLYDQIIK